MLSYLQYGRTKTRDRLRSLDADALVARCPVTRLYLSVGELVLDSIRHVHHHTAQLNLMLRQRTDSAPRWVSKGSLPLRAR